MDLLQIKELQCKAKLIDKDRLSNKLNRRDVAYYDLYALHEPHQEYHTLRTGGGAPTSTNDMTIPELYGDMAYEDFNTVFRSKGDVVQQQYGDTIQVRLELEMINAGEQDSLLGRRFRMTRHVKEDMRMKKSDELVTGGKGKKATIESDHQLATIEAQLQNLEREFGRDHALLAEVFCAVSGQMPKVREYLTLERQYLQEKSQRQ